MPTPGDWKDAIREKTIDVLPLAREPKKQRTPGWCTYTYEHEQAPELEVLCGGINSKTPHAGAVWRQGFLVDLTEGAFYIAVKHGIKGSLLEVELDLYRAFRSVIRRVG